MPIRDAEPLLFVPTGVSDAVDSVFNGACQNLQNLVFDRTNRGAVVPRPGVTTVTSFPGFSTPGVVSAMLTVGTLIYGMIATARNPGSDEPFVYDTAAGVFLTVAGVQASNVPTTPAASGSWVPPTMAVIGTRIVVTHPGFSGANFIGWFDISGVSVTPTATTAINNAVLTAVSSVVGIQVGMLVAGAGIPANSYVISFTSTTITLNNQATASATVTITVVGGTASAPLWGAGNTHTNALPSVPLWVSQFYGRAYYGVGNQTWMSDILAATVIGTTGAANVLTFGDSSHSTGACGLPVGQTSGGILQALIVFKGAAIYQITGDPGSSNLALNTLADNIGCTAPRTAVPTPFGVFFISTDGPRMINLSGQVAYLQPQGNDLVAPFAAATTPSRMCAAYNNSTYRVGFDATWTVWNQNYTALDYWLDTMFGKWNGSHTFAYHCAIPIGSSFYLASNNQPGALYQSGSVLSSASVYTDNLNAYNCLMVGGALNGAAMAMSAIVESTIELCSSAESSVYYFVAYDDQNNPLSIATLSLKTPTPLWGGPKFGQFKWRSSQIASKNYTIPWVNPIVTKKLILYARVDAAEFVSMKTCAFRVQPLGYTNNA